MTRLVIVTCLLHLFYLFNACTTFVLELTVKLYKGERGFSY